MSARIEETGRLEEGQLPCFAAGTLVHTKEGLKPIEEIRIGDWVLSYPDDQRTPNRLREDHEYTYKRVTQTFVTEDQQLSKLIVSNLASGERESFFVTPNHRIYNDGKGWTSVAEMDAGDVVENFSFANLMVYRVYHNVDKGRIYNFEVDDFHTYYVGEQGVWVHNKCNEPQITKVHDVETLTNKTEIYRKDYYLNPAIKDNPANTGRIAEDAGNIALYKSTGNDFRTDMRNKSNNGVDEWFRDMRPLENGSSPIGCAEQSEARRSRTMRLVSRHPILLRALSCFAGGTLVHTKDGLKPIETIQVGDWVLSKHESGEGEREYKRVTKTFVHEDRQVIMISCGGKQANGSQRFHDLAVTPEHPIWIKGKGWKPAEKLKWTLPFTQLELLADETPNVVANVRLFKTDQPDIAWHPLMSKAEYLGGIGKHVHVPSMQVVETDVFIGIDYVRTAKRTKPEHLYTTTVYNLEVEDFHTYYVGEPGIWVHNKNIQLSAKAASGYIPTATEVANPYLSRSELTKYLNKFADDNINNIDKLAELRSKRFR